MTEFQNLSFTPDFLEFFNPDIKVDVLQPNWTLSFTPGKSTLVVFRIAPTVGSISTSPISLLTKQSVANTFLCFVNAITDPFRKPIYVNVYDSTGKIIQLCTLEKGSLCVFKPGDVDFLFRQVPESIKTNINFSQLHSVLSSSNTVDLNCKQFRLQSPVFDLDSNVQLRETLSLFPSALNISPNLVHDIRLDIIQSSWTLNETMIRDGKVHLFVFFVKPDATITIPNPSTYHLYSSNTVLYCLNLTTQPMNVLGVSLGNPIASQSCARWNYLSSTKSWEYSKVAWNFNFDKRSIIESKYSPLRIDAPSVFLPRNITLVNDDGSFVDAFSYFQQSSLDATQAQDQILKLGSTSNTLGIQLGNKSTSNTNVEIYGNLNVYGTKTYLEVQDLKIEDKNIVLNKGGAIESIVGAGIQFASNSNDDQGHIQVLDNSFEFKHPITQQLYVIDQTLSKDSSPTFVTISISSLDSKENAISISKDLNAGSNSISAWKFTASETLLSPQFELTHPVDVNNFQFQRDATSLHIAYNNSILLNFLSSKSTDSTVATLLQSPVDLILQANQTIYSMQDLKIATDKKLAVNTIESVDAVSSINLKNNINANNNSITQIAALSSQTSEILSMQAGQPTSHSFFLSSTVDSTTHSFDLHAWDNDLKQLVQVLSIGADGSLSGPTLSLGSNLHGNKQNISNLDTISLETVVLDHANGDPESWSMRRQMDATSGKASILDLEYNGSSALQIQSTNVETTLQAPSKTLILQNNVQIAKDQILQVDVLQKSNPNTDALYVDSLLDTKQNDLRTSTLMLQRYENGIAAGTRWDLQRSKQDLIERLNFLFGNNPIAWLASDGTFAGPDLKLGDANNPLQLGNHLNAQSFTITNASDMISKQFTVDYDTSVDVNVWEISRSVDASTQKASNLEFLYNNQLTLQIQSKVDDNGYPTTALNTDSEVLQLQALQTVSVQNDMRLKSGRKFFVDVLSSTDSINAIQIDTDLNLGSHCVTTNELSATAIISDVDYQQHSITNLYQIKSQIFRFESFSNNNNNNIDLSSWTMNQSVNPTGGHFLNMSYSNAIAAQFQTDGSTTKLSTSFTNLEFEAASNISFLNNITLASNKQVNTNTVAAIGNTLVLTSASQNVSTDSVQLQIPLDLNQQDIKNIGSIFGKPILQSSLDANDQSISNVSVLSTTTLSASQLGLDLDANNYSLTNASNISSSSATFTSLKVDKLTAALDTNGQEISNFKLGSDMDANNKSINNISALEVDTISASTLSYIQIQNDLDMKSHSVINGNSFMSKIFQLQSVDANNQLTTEFWKIGGNEHNSFQFFSTSKDLVTQLLGSEQLKMELTKDSTLKIQALQELIPSSGISIQNDLLFKTVRETDPYHISTDNRYRYYAQYLWQWSGDEIAYVRSPWNVKETWNAATNVLQNTELQLINDTILECEARGETVEDATTAKGTITCNNLSASHVISNLLTTQAFETHAMSILGPFDAESNPIQNTSLVSSDVKEELYHQSTLQTQVELYFARFQTTFENGILKHIRLIDDRKEIRSLDGQTVLSSALQSHDVSFSEITNRFEEINPRSVLNSLQIQVDGDLSIATNVRVNVGNFISSDIIQATTIGGTITFESGVDLSKYSLSVQDLSATNLCSNLNANSYPISNLKLGSSLDANNFTIDNLPNLTVDTLSAAYAKSATKSIQYHQSTVSGQTIFYYARFQNIVENGLYHYERLDDVKEVRDSNLVLISSQAQSYQTSLTEIQSRGENVSLVVNPVTFFSVSDFTFASNVQIAATKQLSTDTIAATTNGANISILANLSLPSYSLTVKDLYATTLAQDLNVAQHNLSNILSTSITNQDLFYTSTVNGKVYKYFALYEVDQTCTQMQFSRSANFLKQIWNGSTLESETYQSFDTMKTEIQSRGETFTFVEKSKQILGLDFIETTQIQSPDALQITSDVRLGTNKILYTNLLNSLADTPIYVGSSGFESTNFVSYKTVTDPVTSIKTITSAQYIASFNPTSMSLIRGNDLVEQWNGTTKVSSTEVAIQDRSPAKTNISADEIEINQDNYNWSRPMLIFSKDIGLVYNMGLYHADSTGLGERIQMNIPNNASFVVQQGTLTSMQITPTSANFNGGCRMTYQESYPFYLAQKADGSTIEYTGRYNRLIDGAGAQCGTRDIYDQVTTKNKYGQLTQQTYQLHTDSVAQIGFNPPDIWLFDPNSFTVPSLTIAGVPGTTNLSPDMAWKIENKPSTNYPGSCDLAFTFNGYVSAFSVDQMGDIALNGKISLNSTTYPHFDYNSQHRMVFGATGTPPNELGSVVSFSSGDRSRKMLFQITSTGNNSGWFGNDGSTMIIGAEAAAPISFRTGLSYVDSDILSGGSERLRIPPTGPIQMKTRLSSLIWYFTATANVTVHELSTGQNDTLYYGNAGIIVIEATSFTVTVALPGNPVDGEQIIVYNRSPYGNYVSALYYLLNGSGGGVLKPYSWNVFMFFKNTNSSIWRLIQQN